MQRKHDWLKVPARDGEDGGGGGGTPPPATSWVDALPQDIRGHAALTGVKDIADLASRYVSVSKPFAEQLPEDIRSEPTFQGIKDLASLAKSYHHAQKMIGVPKDQLLRLPATDKPEDWAPVWNKLGRPEKEDGYKLDGVEPETMKALGKTAHDLGLSQRQLEGMHKWLAENVTANQGVAEQQRKAALDTTVSDLKAEWGSAYPQRLADAEGAVNALEATFPGLKEALNVTDLGNKGPLVKFFAKYAATLREQGTLPGRSAGGFDVASPVEAQQQIAALKQDRQFMQAYTDRNHIGHKAAVDKMTALYNQGFPSAA